ncbi:YtxH domain-containing protein [Neobacillus sp. SuZ13]|uniref:YtxH domain-containing protein n=1 Tax=Neobacillus sp. SuZ13 TaxID=3047875 RepID=UPI0024BFAFD4|nr:YtxH domain-containing protein [Neobacillus sp. SuZ13]WHY66009.1 YtxH domain-containing protein [Neobacillus sp. SuZ13]
MSNRDFDSRETNQARNEESSNSFLLGAIIGGVVGAATALFLAPKSGKDLRNRFSNQAGSIIGKTSTIRDNVISKSNELVSKSSSLSQGIVLQSTGLLDKVKGKITNQSEQVDESESTYIPIQPLKEKSKAKKSIEIGTLNSTEIRRKIEEAEKALEEEENKVKL